LLLYFRHNHVGVVFALPNFESILVKFIISNTLAPQLQLVFSRLGDNYGGWSMDALLAEYVEHHSLYHRLRFAGVDLGMGVALVLNQSFKDEQSCDNFLLPETCHLP
jgi:hypothetical protein